MWPDNIKRVFRSGFINFWRSPVVALASIVTITAALFVFGAVYLGGVFLDSSLEDIKSKVDISVSFKPATAEADVATVEKSLKALPEVKTVESRSRENELSDFKERNKDNDLILQSLEEVGNPFGARLNVTAVDPAHYGAIAKFLEGDGVLSAAGETIIDQVSYKKNIIDKLVGVIVVSKRIGWAITFILIFISIIVTFNTIALAIYVSREEIGLMKLVGAGDNYVRGPFLVEGIISGVIASVLATGLLYPVTIWVRNQTSGVYGGVNLVAYFVDNLPKIFLMLLCGGILLGIVASFLAIRKHLKI
ncbi:MAG: FtsX-like permease family protein [Candidatus Vogelbacteria bacterium]|nr:FtsX-like permease family protein [Candidatus Vogelbacteria bacterium]